MAGVFAKYVAGKEGKAQAVLLHGDLQNHTSLKRIAEYLQEKGHATLLIDLPGHGLSPVPEEDTDLIATLQECLKEYGIAAPLLISHSFGSALSVGYSLKTPAVAGMVLISPVISSPRHIHPSLDWDAIVEQHLQSSQKYFQQQELVNYDEFAGTEETIQDRGLKTTHPRGFERNIDFYKSMGKNEEIYGLDIPILIVASKDDYFAPLAYAQQCALKMKNARLSVVNGGHNSLITHREEVLQSIKDNYEFFADRKA